MPQKRNLYASMAEGISVALPVKAWSAVFDLRVCRRLGMLGSLAVMLGSVRVQSQTLADRPEMPPASVLAREMLTAHNAVRSELKVPPLQWSGELAAFSQEWADRLVARRRFAHNPESPYGENLFMITGAAASCAMVVKQWASESRDYDYHTNTCTGVCGHYTQIVWRRTRRVGCAVARGSGREVWVCSYDPPGNFVGERPY